MTPAIVLAILVASNDAQSAETRAMRVAAAEALGSEALVTVREQPSLSDDAALTAEDQLRAASVVQVMWLDAARTSARVRLHVAETRVWIDRTVTFSPADTPPERGRTLGFAVTSMLPEEVLAARSRIVLPRDEAAAPARPAPPPPAAATGPAPSPPPLRYAFRLAADGSTGIDGTAAGTGGALDAEFFFGPAPSLRVGFAARTGDVPGLAGSDTTMAVRAGFALWPLAPSAGAPVSVGVQVDALALHHDLSHRSNKGEVTRLARWLPGMDVLVELGLRVERTVYLVAAVGGEIAFGATDVRVNTQLNGEIVDSQIVATIPPLRGVAELGLRFLF
jgi:hypothetical protein